MGPDRFGKYAVLRRIASGGMGDVYLCRHAGEAGFEKKVAVKAIHPRLCGDPRFREMFAREARIAAALSHPNLVQVFDFGRQGESLFLAMEYVPGESLARALAQIRLRSLPVPLPVWRHWMEGILAGLGYLHGRKIVHRDISPSNVLLSRAGAVKIADFGIARVARAGDGGAPGRGGKCSYMAPEQARGGEATFASDLFAVAVMAAEVFLPGRLFPGESAEEVLAAVRAFDPGRLPANLVPPPVLDAIARGLSAVPEYRYADAGVFATAVRSAAPSVAAAGDLSAFWDFLFPEAGEESTVVDLPAGGEVAVVREPGAAYGVATARRAAIGAATALAAVTVGGALLWKGTRLGETPAPSPAPAASAASSPAQRSSSPPDGGAGRSASTEGIGSPIRMGSGAEPEILPPGPKADRAPLRPDRTSEAVGGRYGGSGGTERSGPGPAASAATSGAGPETPLPGRPFPSTPSVRIVTDPPGVSISAGEGMTLGRTPLVLDPARWAGKNLLFEKSGYVSRTFRAELLEGLGEFRLEMDRETGTILAVQANPWARVSVDGRYLGDTPLRDLVLPAGDHRLRFDNPDLGVAVEENVTVRPGKNPKIVVDLFKK